MTAKKMKHTNSCLTCVVMLCLLTLGSALLAVASQPPIAEAEPDYQMVNIEGEAWFCGGNSYDPDGSIIFYYWDFGDGTTGNGINIARFYNNPDYNIIAPLVTDNDNASEQGVATVVVEEPNNDLPQGNESKPLERDQNLSPRGNDIEPTERNEAESNEGNEVGLQAGSKTDTSIENHSWRKSLISVITMTTASLVAFTVIRHYKNVKRKKLKKKIYQSIPNSR